ncbi:MAG: 30S ribosomal protein S6 [Acidobacteriota bacterium]|jgi:small subunit ribosomal protein S6
MRTYELMYIIDSRISEEEAESVHETVKGLVTGNGAEITRDEDMGRRKLAYPIDKQTEGRYRLLYLHGEDSLNVPEVERRLEQSDKVLRYLTVRTDVDLKRAFGEVTPELAAGMTGEGEAEETAEEG